MSGFLYAGTALATLRHDSAEAHGDEYSKDGTMGRSHQNSIAPEPFGSGESPRVQIEELEAPLSDAEALERLLAAIPYPQTVRPLLQRPFFGRRWECVPGCDYWLASDGVRAVYLKITGANTYTVARLRMLFDDMRNSERSLMPSAAVLRELLMTTARHERSSGRESLRATESA